MASARSAGSPHTPRPVSCIAPNPSRWTGSSPLIATVPLLASGAALATEGCFFLPALSRMCCSFFLSAVIGPPFALDSIRRQYRFGSCRRKQQPTRDECGEALLDTERG